MTLQPHVLMWSCTLGTFLVYASSGDIWYSTLNGFPVVSWTTSSTTIGPFRIRALTYACALAASHQNSTGNSASSSIALTLFSVYWIDLSAVPFCAEVCGSVVWTATPSDSSHSLRVSRISSALSVL